MFEWSGNNPLPPEMWLLPYILPVQPGESFLLLSFGDSLTTTHLLHNCEVNLSALFLMDKVIGCRTDVVSLSYGISTHELYLWKAIHWKTDIFG